MKALHCPLSLTNINIVCDCLGSEQLRKAVGKRETANILLCITGIVSRDENFLKDYNKYVLSIHALMVFTIF
jgi:hypothetical protein